MTGIQPSQLGAMVLVLLLVASVVLGASVAQTDAGASVPRQGEGLSTNGQQEVDEEALEEGMHVRYVLSPVDSGGGRLEDGRVRVRTEFRLSSSVSRVVIGVPSSASVLDTDGFTPSDATDSEYEWDGSPRASVTYETDAAHTANGGLESASTDEWSFIYAPAIELERLDWWYRSSKPPSSRTLALGAGVEGYAGKKVAVVGDVTVTESTRNGHTYRVVRSAAAKEARPAETVLDLLTDADAAFPVGDRGASTTVVLPPDEIRTGGLATIQRGADREFWAHGSSEIYAHELVHVRQTFTVEDDGAGRAMQWLVEGMAEYHAAVVELRAGRLTHEEFRDRVTTERHADAVLTDRSTWESGGAPYEKGRRVVAALDAEIHEATDGERSFVDVWRRLNDHDGPVDYAEFAAVVEAVSGEDVRDWLDRYVAGDEAPPIGETPDGLLTAPETPQSGDGVEASGDSGDASIDDGDASAVAASSREPGVPGGEPALPVRPYVVPALVAVLSTIALGWFLVPD